jgi:hypothetical protein
MADRLLPKIMIDLSACFEEAFRMALSLARLFLPEVPVVPAMATESCRPCTHSARRCRARHPTSRNHCNTMQG